MDDHARFTPNPAHLERVFRLLQHYYPKRSPLECRLALARMYGHEDWEALQAVIRYAGAASAFDEDVAPEIVGARFQQQYDMVLAILAGISDESMLAAQTLDQEVFAVDRESISKRYHPAFNEKRLERARCAHALAYARQTVLEIRPTAKASPDVPPDRDDIDLSYRVDLLPRGLMSWLAHHRPLLRSWGERIGQMEVHQHVGTSLLKFAHAWGEACLDCAVEIPKPLQLYPIVLSAKWFAWIACSRMPRLQSAFAVLHADASSDEQRARASAVIAEATLEEEARFILTQPREDFRSHSASAREQHIHAGYALVRCWMNEAATRSTVRGIMSRSVLPVLSPAMPAG